jgi:ribosome maturation factor RimP
MKDVAEIEPVIEPTLVGMGYRLVRVRFFGGGQPRLQVMAEREDDGTMTVDDCADLSRAISAVLDVEDPLPGSYLLEVSSPGMDRPLVRIGDFERFAGYEARIETGRPIDGRKRFRGKLLGVSQGIVKIALDGAQAEVPFEDIAAAKLVVTDSLIEASLKQREV